MILTLIRYFSDKNTSLSRLFVDSQFQCYALEDEFRLQKVKSETRIPCGTYKITLRYSPRFSPVYGHDMLYLNNVPNFEGILIHSGNTEHDTSGCILVGTTVNDTILNQSRAAYKELYDKVANKAKIGELFISIIDWDRI